MSNWWRCIICRGLFETEKRAHLHITGPSGLSTPPGRGHDVREEIWRKYVYETDIKINSICGNSIGDGEIK